MIECAKQKKSIRQHFTSICLLFITKIPYEIFFFYNHYHHHLNHHHHAVVAVVFIPYVHFPMMFLVGWLVDSKFLSSSSLNTFHAGDLLLLLLIFILFIIIIIIINTIFIHPSIINVQENEREKNQIDMNLKTTRRNETKFLDNTIYVVLPVIIYAKQKMIDHFR